MVRWKIILEIVMLTTVLGGVAGAAPADRNVTVNGLNIHYLDWGPAGKQPLILLHGIARTARTFDHVAPHFTAKLSRARRRYARTRRFRVGSAGLLRGRGLRQGH